VQGQANGSGKKENQTILGKLMDLKIYVAAGTAVFLLLAALAISRVRRRKKTAQLDLAHYR